MFEKGSTRSEKEFRALAIKGNAPDRDPAQFPLLQFIAELRVRALQCTILCIGACSALAAARVLDILSADSGKVIQSFPITDGVDAARYDPATRDVFVSTFAGRLHIFHEDSSNHFTALPVVTTEMGAKTRQRGPPDAPAVLAP